MAAIDNLNAAYTNVTAIMASITANPKPTYSIDGKNVSWTEYLQMLTTQLIEIEKAIQRASGPFQIPTKMVT